MASTTMNMLQEMQVLLDFLFATSFEIFVLAFLVVLFVWACRKIGQIAISQKRHFRSQFQNSENTSETTFDHSKVVFRPF